MKSLFKGLGVIVLSIILSNCSTKSSINMKSDSYKAGCEAEVKILKSYGDTLRIEHSPADYEEAMNISKGYCAERKKLSTKNQSSCDGCCRTTYICKGKLVVEDKS
tara:strand:+ start:213 stop:530 length:318 start_codon:yes stop_codon:yes gene_type:complete